MKRTHEGLQHDAAQENHHQPEIRAYDEENGPLAIHRNARMARSHDVDAGHHAVVLVFEIVTMEKVASLVTAPPHDDVHVFPVFDRNGVFPAALLPKRRAPVPAQYLEWREMCVHRMQHRLSNKRSIHKAPELDLAESWLGVDAQRIE